MTLMPTNIQPNDPDHIDHHDRLHAHKHLLRVVTLTGSGTYTPGGDVLGLLVKCVGGGGGGGGGATAASSGAGGGGGAGGGTSIKWISTPAASYSYDVGPGGAGGTAGANDGTAGTDTTFGNPSVCTGPGGDPGLGSTAKAGVQGAANGGDPQGGHVGDEIYFGEPGRPGIVINPTSGSGTIPGKGGSAALGGGGGKERFSQGTGLAGSFPGGGGAGGCVANGGGNAAGGAGANGTIVIYEYGV